MRTDHAEKFYRDRDDRFVERLRTSVRWIGKAEETLRRCALHAPLGMMTAAKRRFIAAMDARLHLSPLFAAIVTRDETGTKMKPDPYGLLLLAERLGVAPEFCLYVGDQHVDVQAAKNARMSACLLKTKETPDGAAVEANMVIERIEELAELLGY